MLARFFLPALLGCLFLFAAPGTAAAQRLESFPSDPQRFLESMDSLMSSTGNERAEKSFRNFSGLFIAVFDETEQRLIMDQADLMQQKRLRVSPHFAEYLETLDALGSAKSVEAPDNVVKTWHGVLRKTMENPDFRVNDLSALLTFTRAFAQERRLHPSAEGTNWFTPRGEAVWSYDGKPLLKVTGTDLTAVSNGDSLTIKDTGGTLDILAGTWTGTGGRVDWQRTGLPAEVYADLNSYHLETKRSLYEADDAVLHYPQYFAGGQLKGQFTDKLVAGNIKSGGSYPRFVSSDGYVEMDNVGENISLRGSFQLEGSTVYATSTGNRKAEVEVMITDKDKKPKLIGRSGRFAVKRGERVVGEGVATTIYFDQDSLFHPSVNLRIDVEEQVVKLSRGNSGSDANPFYHSLNRVNLDADYIDIYLEQDSMVVGKPTVSFAEKKDVKITSDDYFSASDYFRIQNISSVNPLALMLALRKERLTNYLDADDLAQRINPKFTAQNIQSMLYDLAAEGFVNYEPEENLVEVKDKVEHYVMADRAAKDYDQLQIVSQSDSANAEINLRTGRLFVRGAKPLELNKKKRVAIKPLDGRLVMLGDRNIDFAGTIYAGNTLMEGKDLHFQYQPYQIAMDSVRYFDLFIPNEEGTELLSLTSRIEHLAGTLLIDAPNNKSGKENVKIFPALESKGSSYVYYDEEKTEEGAYGRDSFFFEIKPFTLEHLHVFGRDYLKFPGKLVSGGVFSDIDETLLVQDDNSLGFTTETDPKGEQLYGERGTYAGAITLSNKGLRGSGKLSYIGAEINSEDLVFRPNGTTGSADAFVMEEERGTREVPQIRGEGVKIDWRPYVDSMYVRSVGDAPFALYQENDHKFDGMLILTPDGVRGDGTLDWSAAALTSADIDFGAYSARADTSDVKIKSLAGDDRLALQTNNVISDLDFDKQVGTFESNDDKLKTTLPYNQYLTSINKFDWDMAGASVTFKSGEFGKGRFTSIHPDQDSLTFEGDEAFYDLTTSLLRIEGVPFVTTADAFVYPDSNRIRIEPDAKMTTLTNARIVADTANQYHVINRATVIVEGRRKYRASGFYEYNLEDGRQQEFELQDIVGQPIGKGKYEEKLTTTRAEGAITDSMQFYIDRLTRFRGKILLDAGSKNLQFEGHAQLETDKIRPKWFSVNSEGDRKDLALDINSPQDLEGFPLHTGYYLSKEQREVYPSFIQTLTFRKDRPILPIVGVFKYDKEKDRFIFGDSTRVMGAADSTGLSAAALKGNRLVFDNAEGNASGDGKLNLGSELKYVKVTAAGRIASELPPPPADEPEEEETPAAEAPPSDIMTFEETIAAEDTTGTADSLLAPVDIPLPPVNIQAMAAIDLILPANLLKIIATDFTSASFATPGINVLGDQEFYRGALVNLFPAGKELDETLANMALGYIDLPKKINPHTLLFSRLPMRWSPEYQSFVTTEKESGLISIAGESINKTVEIHVEMKMPSGGDDRLYIYLKSPSELYYFLGFKDGILNVTSNNTVFMDNLESMKGKDLVMKMEDGETYEILPVELSTASTFLRRVGAAFSGAAARD